MVGKGGISTRHSGKSVEVFERPVLEVSSDFRKKYPDVSAKYDMLRANLPNQ